MKTSPLAPANFPKLPVIDGVTFATAEAGVKYSDRADVMLALLAPGTAVAGVFTKSATRSANVLDCQAKLGNITQGPAAILVSSGNSNAFTGGRGVEAVKENAKAVAKATGVPQERVFTASTGVIGEPLPYDKIIAQLDGLTAMQSPAGIEDAARAIMTTDTFAKGAGVEVVIGDKPVKIVGIAKGSGMIAPDMATMLVYIFTDALCDQESLQLHLSELTETSFNCITVDSDTSTSDTLMLCATGASGINVADDANFLAGLNTVMLDLAHQVVRDGEGATKFVTINVTGADNDSDAKTIGLSIANSPLVKTAIAGQDPNWGRIVMAVGKSGAKADRDKLTIRFGDILVAEKGWVAPSYTEEAGANYMTQENIDINVDLGIGDGKATIWTCDLTHGYITINADYRS